MNVDARPESATTPSPKFVAWLTDRQARIAVTGASGWIGRAVVHLALAAGLDPGGGRLRLFGSRSHPLELCGRRLEVEGLADAPQLGDGDWIVLHLAIVGPDRVAGCDPSDTRRINDALLAQAMQLTGSGAVRRLVFTSSGAAGRAAVAIEPPSYGAMKRAHEAALRDWAERRGQPTLTARVFNLGGPYMQPVERYALGAFIQAARRGGPITVAAQRGVFRSYVHVLELARVLFDQALDEARPAIAFDTCGREIVEMGDLARTVAQVVGGDCPIERAEIKAADPDWYVGSGEAYQAALLRSGAAPCDLRMIIGDTAAYLADPKSG